MNGWLYLIRNGDLYKIGITRNFENRMKQLKPDMVVSKLYSSEFKKLEKEFHKRYKNLRIPQSEYFRLEDKQIIEIKRRISMFYYPKRITLYTFINSIKLLLLIFLLLFLLLSTIINDTNNALLIAFYLMEKISFAISFFSLFIKSNKYLGLLNELRFRVSRFCILFLFAVFFRSASRFLF
tara:strand:- start:813 stop:1355 length:543 start_codon:yes stop_codon:yes gene_type:complete